MPTPGDHDNIGASADAATGADAAPDARPDAAPDARPGTTGAVVDPVRVRRAKVARWTLLANRVGYLFVAVAMALFFLAFAFGFTPTMASLIIGTFVIGCVLLAPSIVIGYAVKAAERDDRERGL